MLTVDCCCPPPPRIRSCAFGLSLLKRLSLSLRSLRVKARTALHSLRSQLQLPLLRSTLSLRARSLYISISFVTDCEATQLARRVSHSVVELPLLHLLPFCIIFAQAIRSSHRFKQRAISVGAFTSQFSASTDLGVDLDSTSFALTVPSLIDSPTLTVFLFSVSFLICTSSLKCQLLRPVKGNTINPTTKSQRRQIRQTTTPIYDSPSR